MKATSLHGWKVELLNPVTGSVIATDTNGDGVWDGDVTINTGTLAPGGVAGVLPSRHRAVERRGGGRPGSHPPDGHLAPRPVGLGHGHGPAHGHRRLQRHRPDPARQQRCRPGRRLEDLSAPDLQQHGLADTFDLAIYNEMDPSDPGHRPSIGMPTATAATPRGSTRHHQQPAARPGRIAAHLRQGGLPGRHSRPTRVTSPTWWRSRATTSTVFGAASDTTTVVEAGSHDLSGGGTRSVVPSSPPRTPARSRARFDLASSSTWPRARRARRRRRTPPPHRAVDRHRRRRRSRHPIATDTEGDGTWDDDRRGLRPVHERRRRRTACPRSASRPTASWPTSCGASSPRRRHARATP